MPRVAAVGMGARALGDFAEFGPDVAQAVAEADVVIGICADGAHELHTGEEVALYTFDDADSALLECAGRIKAAWEEQSVSPELGHAAAGFWLFYWTAPDLKSMRELVLQGRISDLRAAAADYIASGFGADRGPMIQAELLA